jgi:plastocyanin
MLRTASVLLACLACVVLGSADAAAAGLRVTVRDQRGAPVPDAVIGVWAEDAAIATPPPAPPRTLTVDQVALEFVPYITVLRPGDRVVFRNSDRTRHHVYSFSPVKAFEFVLAPGQSSAPMALARDGVVAVGCNIHDTMIAYLYVTRAPWSLRTDARGVASIDGLAPGSYTVRTWQPRLRPGKPDIAQTGVVLANGAPRAVAVSLKLLPDARLQFDRERTRY